MTAADEVIAALESQRMRRSGRSEQHAAGWQAWFAALQPVDPAMAQAQVQGWVDAALHQTAAVADGDRWPAWLFFHRWLRRHAPPPHEGRRLRIGAMVADALLHVGFLALLLWLMYLRFLALMVVPEEASVVQVSFIGRGNAQNGGGAASVAGDSAAPAATRRQSAATKTSRAEESASAQEAAAARPELAQQALPMLTIPLKSDEVPAREALPSTPVAAPSQELQVSEVAQPAPQAFQLPPPRRAAPVPAALPLREVSPQVTVEALPNRPELQVRTLQAPTHAATVRMPELQTQVQAIDTEAPDARFVRQTRSVAPLELPLREATLRHQVQALPQREAGQTAASAATSTAGDRRAATRGGEGAQNATGAGAGQAGAGAGVRPAATAGHGGAATGTSGGAQERAATGGWPGVQGRDDWGNAGRHGAGRAATGREAGGASGLFNPDGSVRLPDTWTKASGIDLDRAGTWLKRPGLSYQGTRFDRYWIPDGSLLEEWVRRGIKALSIPIPGTGLELKCVVSLLQFGGACFPADPNANEQPAQARPAPDVPFKPQWQDDKDSLFPVPPAGGQ